MLGAAIGGAAVLYIVKQKIASLDLEVEPSQSCKREKTREPLQPILEDEYDDELPLDQEVYDDDEDDPEYKENSHI